MNLYRFLLLTTILLSNFAFSEEASPDLAQVDSQGDSSIVSHTDVADSNESVKASVDSLFEENSSIISKPAVAEAKIINETPISGEISGFLKAEGSPYLVKESIRVPTGRTLVIEAGTVLLFSPGTGLFAENAQIVIAGTEFHPVIFRSTQQEETSGNWQGITINGDVYSEFRYTIIENAVCGILVENGNLNLLSSEIISPRDYGVFVHNSNLSVNLTTFESSSGVGLFVSKYSEVYIENSEFTGNQFGALFMDGSRSLLNFSTFQNNDYGILFQSQNTVTPSNLSFSRNRFNLVSSEPLMSDWLDIFNQNPGKVQTQTSILLATLPPLPETHDSEKKAFDASQNKQKTVQSSWNFSGNILSSSYYRFIRTRNNYSGKSEIVGNDTVGIKERFPNTFYPRGLGFNGSIYAIAESNDGKTVEFSSDIYSDQWSSWGPNSATLRYTDSYHEAVLGDFSLSGGSTYMSGVSAFGALYNLSLGKNVLEEPLFKIGGFFGEVERSIVPGSRNPYVFNDSVIDGEAQAQRIAFGGELSFKPIGQFSLKLGSIFSDDEIHDPLLRDGAAKEALTSDPMLSAMAIYADASWLFLPGDIALNGQISVGKADTADVYRERAINQVFSKAGLSTSSLSLLRKLMQNSSLISSLSREELLTLFGTGTVLSNGEMRDSLRTLIAEAKKVQKDFESDRDDTRTLGLNWGSQNFALAGSLGGKLFNTNFFAEARYIGARYYSPGSSDQLSNSREFTAQISKDILKRWNLDLGYDLTVQNAANGSKDNLFGFGEGTHAGLFPSTGEDSWHERNLLTEDRAKYIQDAKIGNQFKITPKFSFIADYQFGYQKQYTPRILRADVSLSSGIYNDPWFATKKGQATDTLVLGNSSLVVDSTRLAKYQSIAGADTIAYGFQERFYRNSVRAGVSAKLFSTQFLLSGRFSWNTDASRFLRDSLIQDIDFADSTWGKLGYYFGGSNSFEHSYPLTATTYLSSFSNQFSFTPRWKKYNRDAMNEFEWNLSDRVEIPLFSEFLVIGLSGEIRSLKMYWKEATYALRDTATGNMFFYYKTNANGNITGAFESEDGATPVSSHLAGTNGAYRYTSGRKKVSEKEMDFIAELSLRFNITQTFYSELIFRGEFYDRPDRMMDEYKELCIGLNLFSSF